MAFGETTFISHGSSGLPSPSVWGDCPNERLLHDGMGYYVHRDGLGGLTSLPGLRTDSDSETFAYDDGTNGDNRTVNATTGSTDNNSLAMLTSAMAKMVKNGNNRLWFEADIALAEIADQAVFVGLAEQATLDRDIVSDNPGNDSQAGLSDNDLVGFVSQQNSSSTNKFDAVYRQKGDNVQTVLADVGNASAFSPGTATGVAVDRDQTTATKPGDLSADQFVRFGVRFNGRTKVLFFVNGLKVAEQELDSGFPQDDEMGGIVAIKTGAASARTLRYRFIRTAAQVSH
jgi:hypothetical protein